MRKAKRIAASKTRQEKQRERDRLAKIKRAEAKAVRVKSKKILIDAAKSASEFAALISRALAAAARAKAHKIAQEQARGKTFDNRVIDLQCLKRVRLNDSTQIYTKTHIPEGVTLFKFINRKPKFLEQWEQ